MWLENGLGESMLRDDFDERTHNFIGKARTSLQYQTFVALRQNKIVGSVSCQQWEGPIPMCLKASAMKMGTVWAVYVDPEYRREGIATMLMGRVIAYWREIGCHKGLLLHASEEGRRVYSRLGFSSGNMVLHDFDTPELKETVVTLQKGHKAFGLQFAGAKDFAMGETKGYGIVIAGKKENTASADNGDIKVGQQLTKITIAVTTEGKSEVQIDLTDATLQEFAKHLRKVRNTITCTLKENKTLAKSYGVGQDTNVTEAEAQVEAEDTTTSFSFGTVDAKGDKMVVEHWRKMWMDCGLTGAQLEEKFNEITLDFLANARKNLQYQTFVATDADGKVVGSMSAQVWDGVIPNVLHDTVFKLGTIWAVYVDPAHRTKGIASKLLGQCLAYLQRIGCTRSILVSASEEGKRVYARAGFKPSNAMVLDLSRQSPSARRRQRNPSCITPAQLQANELPDNQDHQLPDLTSSTTSTTSSTSSESRMPKETMVPMDMITALRQCGVSGSDVYLGWLLGATVELLDTLGEGDFFNDLRSQVITVQREFKVFIDPANNWFTQNLHRFGRGFDMKKLSANPEHLVTKFDRLSSKYDVWTVGNKSVVMHWIAKRAKSKSMNPTGLSLADPNSNVLDVACGTGLPGHTLRLSGCQAHITGTDISAGMVDEAAKRHCYNKLFVGNANNGFGDIVDQSQDLIVCTGAMELLNHTTVLKEFARILDVDGELWVSFQWTGEDGNNTSTAHQGVNGITLDTALTELRDAGFAVAVADVEKCPSAFMTPRDGVLLPVPYLFVRAVRS